MPSVDRPGKRGKYVELPVEVHDGFEAFAKERQSSFTVELVHAMRRHMAYPPPTAPPQELPPPAPLGDVPPPAKPAKAAAKPETDPQMKEEFWVAPKRKRPAAKAKPKKGKL